MQQNVRMRSVTPRWACGLISNPLALKPRNFLFLPFFAKIDDATLQKNAKIGQKINFLLTDCDWYLRKQLLKTVGLLTLRLDLAKLRLKNRKKM